MGNTIQQSVKPSIILELDKLVQEVSQHPDLESVIEECDGVRWLAMCNAINGHIETSASMLEVLTRLSNFVHDEFITSDGQHSDLFYTAKKFGYGMRTGESDSFGPLSSIMKPPNGDWQVCYG